MADKKKMLEESTVRKFMKLSGQGRLTESFVKENFKEEVTEEKETDAEPVTEASAAGEGAVEGAPAVDDKLEESSDKIGKAREGAGKDGEHKGIAKNQGKAPPSSPSGKFVPGVKDNDKMKDLSVSKKDIDGGTPLVENDMEGMPASMGGASAMSSAMPESPEMDMGAQGGVDVVKLVKALADAIQASTGIDVSVAGGEGEELGSEMPGEMPAPPAPEVSEPPAGLEGPEAGESAEEAGAEKEKEEDLDETVRKLEETVNLIKKRVTERIIKSAK